MDTDASWTPSGLLFAGSVAGDDADNRASAAAPGAVWNSSSTRDLLSAGCYERCRARSLCGCARNTLLLSDGAFGQSGNRQFTSDRGRSFWLGILSAIIRRVQSG